MLNLYIKTHCPYCLRVLEANKEIKAPVVIKDISIDPKLRGELLEKGGKTQVPFLEDTDKGVIMYESLDIIDYLNNLYGSGNDVEVKPVPNVCPID